MNYSRQMARIIRGKRRYHQSLAELPIARKIEILVNLQRLAATIRPGYRKMVWQIGS